MIYNYHVDPGHGWLEVPFLELIRLGIEKEISHYSYRDNDVCYLEEDCDAYLWEHRYFGHYGRKPEINIVRHDQINASECFIRNLPLYFHL